MIFLCPNLLELLLLKVGLLYEWQVWPSLWLHLRRQFYLLIQPPKGRRCEKVFLKSLRFEVVLLRLMVPVKHLKEGGRVFSECVLRADPYWADFPLGIAMKG